LGGKSSSKGSDAMIREQRAQAEEARAKEAARQGRLTQGLAGIRAAFEGSPVMRSVARSFNFAAPAAGAKVGAGVSGLPAGYTYVRAPGTAAAPRTTAPRAAGYVGGRDAVQPGGGAGGLNPAFSPSSHSGGGYQYGGAGGMGGGGGGGGGGGAWQIRGPDGRLYNVGENISYGTQVDTGKRAGGFGEDFYNKFRQGILDYYNPQVAQKFGEAKDETTYRLARAGTGRSSMAADEMAKLDEQNRINKANVQLQADTGAADLRTRVARERANAESQLYATENPDVAANQALAAVRNLSLDQPDVSPLGDIFKVALIGGANALSGYRNQSTLNKIPGYNKSGTSVVS
jgi:hypothetical protein